MCARARRSRWEEGKEGEKKEVSVGLPGELNKFPPLASLSIVAGFCAGIVNRHKNNLFATARGRGDEDTATRSGHGGTLPGAVAAVDARTSRRYAHGRVSGQK